MKKKKFSVNIHSQFDSNFLEYLGVGRYKYLIIQTASISHYQMLSSKLINTGILRNTTRISVTQWSKSFSTSIISGNQYADFIPANAEQEQFLTRQTEKPLFSRKTYLIDFYKHLYDNNEILLFVHHNNLNKSDNKRYRQELLKSGANLHVIKSSMFKLLLRSINEADPAQKGMSAKNKDKVHDLDPLLAGPTAIITIPKSDPQVVTSVMKVLKSANERLLLIGAKIENNVMNLDEINQFKTLPTKESLQGQLVGLLTIAGGAGLVRTLETPGKVLYLNLDQRKKDMEGPKQEEKTENKE